MTIINVVTVIMVKPVMIVKPVLTALAIQMAKTVRGIRFTNVNDTMKLFYCNNSWL